MCGAPCEDRCVDAKHELHQGTAYPGQHKGILDPELWQAMSPERRDALLAAIAKARGWIEGIRLGRFASFAEIAEHEDQGERHIPLLAPLSLLSPRIIAAIVNATAPTDLTVTGLAKALPYSWAEQERRIGLPL